MAVRNPFVELSSSFVWAAVLTLVLSLPVLVLRGLSEEVSLFYRVVAFAIAGAVAGRAAIFAEGALAATFLGAFVSFVAFDAIAGPRLDLLFAAAFGGIAGIAAWTVSTVVVARGGGTSPMLRIQEKRKCRACGAIVGRRARRCWSCRASLNRIT